jgi:hypothetical protein
MRVSPLRKIIVFGRLSAAFLAANSLAVPVVFADLQFSLANVDALGFQETAGGVAAGDYDKDGDVDLYVATPPSAPNILLKNNGNGGFSNVSAAAGVELEGHRIGGPAFADFNSDGWPDLVVGGADGAGYRVLINDGDGTFSDVSEASGIFQQDERQLDVSSAFGDPDKDGDLDLFVAHWGAGVPTNHLWLNNGFGRFFPGDDLAGIEIFNETDFTFSPTFTDINADGWPDLLIASDHGTSQVLLNSGHARFTVTTTAEIDDENGMGSAAADFDNDGDIDWFVTSIYRDSQQGGEMENIRFTGNRLYQNDGGGNFTDVSAVAGVREGFFGWGACAADFDNDGWLDIFHVNGTGATDDGGGFGGDPSRLFLNQRNGTFAESSSQVGIEDWGLGQGVVCFDYDRDGDIDIFVANSEESSSLYRNDLDANPGFLQIKLQGDTHASAAGARIEVTTGDLTQMREVAIGSNYRSQNPMLQHFGLAGAQTVDSVRVKWPYGGETVLTDVAANQVLDIRVSDGATPPPFQIEPGISSAWYDPERSGEGFMLEILSSDQALLYWFTYDHAGEQDWYIAVGEIDGYRIRFPELLRVSGGEFGPGFDPGQVTEEVVGSAAFIWSSCDSGFMDWSVGTEYGRMTLSRLTRVMGIDCGRPPMAPIMHEALLSGSWYDPAHNGEGYTLEVLVDGRVLLYWFSFGPDGNRRWFFGIGEIRDGKFSFDEMLTTRGGAFGSGFDPATVEEISWGSLELDIACEGGVAAYSSIEEGFGDGSLNVVHLTTLDGLSCDG